MMRSRLTLMTAILALVSLAILGPALLVSAEGNVKDVRLHIKGPNILGQDKMGSYDITLMDPIERNWQYEVYVDANNITGASPLHIEPIAGNLSAETKTFSVDITATSHAGEMMMVINISSPSGTLWYMREFDITVVEPIVISADIFNSGEVAIRNATVEFYIDDIFLSTDTLASLEPGASTTLSSYWVSDEIAGGWHTSKVVVDINNDGKIDPSIGDIEINNKFYVEGSNVSATIYIMIGLIALMVGMMLINRQLKGKKK